MTSSIELIYFSPTGTTREIVSRIADGMNAENIIHHDLTLTKATCEFQTIADVAIIGVPVYAGRVPETCLERFDKISGSGTPAVLVALYGNRAFEDALVELRDLVTARGFTVIAAGAFIGEHSYATNDYPVALARPDEEDCKLAARFGRQVAAKLQTNPNQQPQIAGSTPYRERVQFGGVAPETSSASCTLCNTCAEVCPVAVINIDDSVQTNADNCIICCACVKSCPTGARIFTDEYVQLRREMLLQNCSEPKQPELFL